MSSRPVSKRLDRRIATLKRRRDFLSKRISDYRGTDSSHDKAEYSAIQMAVRIIENNYQLALDDVEKEERSND